MSKVLLRLAMLITAATCTVPARALPYDITVCHISGGCGSQTVFGIVDLEQSGSDVVIDAGVQGGNVFVAPTAAQYTFVFNLPATGRILQFVTTNFSQVSGTSFQDELFGNFNYAIVCISDCGTVLLFKVLNVTVADFLKSTDGTPSVFFAEDIQLAENGNSGSVGALGIREVPIPPAIALFGGGLALLNWASRRKR